jgi:hypothetical protein
MNIRKGPWPLPLYSTKFQGYLKAKSPQKSLANQGFCGVVPCDFGSFA